MKIISIVSTLILPIGMLAGIVLGVALTTMCLHKPQPLFQTKTIKKAPRETVQTGNPSPEDALQKSSDGKQTTTAPKRERPPLPPYHQMILRAASRHALEPALIRAVIMAESSYNPRAVSNRGAKGLMQLMPATAAELGVVDSFDPEQNINGGAKYLRKLMDRFDNDVRLALAAYNAGSRYVRKYNGVPPFQATRHYINKVIKYKTLYQQQPNDHQMVKATMALSSEV